MNVARLPVAALERSLGAALGERVRVADPAPVNGGDIHRALRLRAGGRDWFVKWNEAGALPQFEAERFSLRALAEPACLAVPEALLTDADEAHAWLIMGFESLAAHGDAPALGRGLACLHRHSGPAHGWHADNFIGHTPQDNGRLEDWREFWWRRRLEPQLDRAEAGGHGARIAALRPALEHACATLLTHAPAPSLLHGDLWGGNHAYRPGGEPLIFDPAAWHGDRETDLAMMRLFGGFAPAVFRAYEAAHPLPPGHEQRRPLYQLYHLLNHLNLFGAGWLPRIESLAGRLLQDTGSP